MKIIKKKNSVQRINDNFKYLIIMTVFIIIMMISLPLIFLKGNGNENVHSSIFNLNKNDIDKNQEIEFPTNGKVKLYRREKGIVEELELEEYIKGVVASEMPAAFDKETLKAQAVSARTYYINKRVNPCKDAQNKGAEICDSTNCQVYMDKSERILKWSKNEAENNWSKIDQAVEETKGEVLTYDGKVLEYPQFFAVSSGRTEDAIDVFSKDIPYLKSIESNGEEIAPKYETTLKIPINEFLNKIKAKYKDIELFENNVKNNLEIQSNTSGGGVKEIRVGNKNITGVEFRKILGLNSTNFTIEFEKDNLIFKCKGYGHGLGMSQWGANAMAKKGYGYTDILKHYYKDVEINTIIYK